MESLGHSCVASHQRVVWALRLLNPKILNKNLEQLYKIAALLGLELEWQIKKAP